MKRRRNYVPIKRSAERPLHIFLPLVPSLTLIARFALNFEKLICIDYSREDLRKVGRPTKNK